jgi:hypothetical protein
LFLGLVLIYSSDDEGKEIDDDKIPEEDGSKHGGLVEGKR